jgi:mono/diheme cytochrome c family protein
LQVIEKKESQIKNGFDFSKRKLTTRVMQVKFSFLTPLPLLALFAFSADAQIGIAAKARAIMAENCFDCHGPDKEQRKAELRLDVRVGAIKDLDGYQAVVPGKPDKSELIARLITEDKDELMPPPKTGKSLTKREIEILRQWVQQGADYPLHWSYRPILPPTLPQLKNKEGVQNPIDHFVLAKLESLGHTPSPEADRRTLARRLHCDLLGLPPDPAQVDTFVNDKTPGAYSKLVDELLSSPHFGERWGRHWLDMARYADSDGYEKDKARPNAWRYRDWVIQAINEDLPYDQFTVEQLAGDLLPEATAEQRLATAFHRQTLTNTEGGTDREQWRVAAVMDRLETTGSVWLGLTLTCARCHDHKYDNIAQDEYYQLFAFYNNGDETNYALPTSGSALAKYEKAKAIHDKQVAELDKKLKELLASRKDAQNQWEKETKTRLAAIKNPVAHYPIKLDPSPKQDGYQLVPREDGSIFLEKLVPDKATFVLEFSADTGGKPLTGFRVEALSDPKLPAKGPGLTGHGNFVLSEFRAFVVDLVDPKKKSPLPFASAKADFSQNKWLVQAAIDGKNETGWAISPQMGRNHQATFRLKKPLPAKEASNLRIEMAQLYGSKHVIGHFRIMAVTGEQSRDVVPENVRKALFVDAAKRNGVQSKILADHFAKTDPEANKARKQLDDLRKKAPKTTTTNVRVITQRKANSRKTHVFRRGEFKQPLHEVQAGGLTVLHSLKPKDEKTSGDRLDLARWLVDPANPITPRVTVNQVWIHLFGHGLVRTPEDFGVRGEPPTHPQLMDWLANHFVHDAKWSRKGLIRLIVHSSTYRQSSAHRSELTELDPNNELLHRQNRFRVEAEIVRDLNLASAGLLSDKVGGPSVFPPMPAGIANLSYANSFKWNVSKGTDRYRRGMYTFFKRTSPHPNLLTFDCPDSNVACVKRNRSNTPLAALTTLNNATYAEAAKAFAKRILKEAPPKDEERISHGFRLCVARSPERSESEAFANLLANSRAWYEKHPEDAKNFAGDVETAAWTATLRIMLNMDEFISRE